MDITRRVRISVNKGMKGEYSMETTVEVTFTGPDYYDRETEDGADGNAMFVAQQLVEDADRIAREEVGRRKALD